MKVPIIKGKKVILRPMALSDAGNFCAWLKDEEVTRILLDDNSNPPSIKEEKEYIIEKNKERNSAIFSIDTINGKHIGSTGLLQIDDNKAMLGIFIGDKEYWGQGLGTDAAWQVLKFGFQKLRLHRIYLQVFAFNIRAIKSYKKLGFKKEGILRENLYQDHVYHDEIVMGILKDEFIKKFKVI